MFPNLHFSSFVLFSLLIKKLTSEFLGLNAFHSACNLSYLFFFISPSSSIFFSTRALKSNFLTHTVSKTRMNSLELSQLSFFSPKNQPCWYNANSEEEYLIHFVTHVTRVYISIHQKPFHRWLRVWRYWVSSILWTIKKLFISENISMHFKQKNRP